VDFYLATVSGGIEFQFIEFLLPFTKATKTFLPENPYFDIGE
jgi:hypothetical protein